MRILILNPPFLPKFSRSSRSPAVTKGGTIYYCIWLAYATGVLEQAGHNCKLIDAPASGKSLEDIMRIAKKFNPELLVSDTSTGSIYNDVAVAEKIKKAAGCFVVLVGTHPSALPNETLEISKEIDAVARHEYDYTVRDLAVELEKKEPKLANVEGISFRKREKIVHNPNRPLIEDLDELPFVSEVYKRHLDIWDYFYSANLYPEVTIIAGRGCPYRCSYCLWPQVMNGRGYRPRKVEKVVEEFEYIKENFPESKEVFIEDDTFTAYKERVRDFCDVLKQKNLDMQWSCNARADVDYTTLKKMKEANCRLLCVGIESGEQKILNNIHKGTRIETIRQFMKDTKKVDILVHGCFMLGNQGETKETLKKTVDFAVELNPDTAQFFPIMVYPGTETYEWARKNGYLKSTDFRDWLDENGQHNCMISTPQLSADELVKECDKARIRFYMRPKYVLGKIVQVITNPQEAPRIFKASQIFFKNIRYSE